METWSYPRGILFPGWTSYNQTGQQIGVPFTFTVLWDNDGVLVETEGLYFESSRQVLATLGFVLTVEIDIVHVSTGVLPLLDFVLTREPPPSSERE